MKRGAGGLNEMRFDSGWGAQGGGGNTIPQYLQYKNSDISLITKKSSSLVSHFLKYTH
jgi:hypothetical protein